MESQQQDLKAFTESRQGLFARVQRCYDAFLELDVNSVDQAKPRYERMLMIESEFDTLQAKIIKLNSKVVPPNKPLEVEAIQSSFETLFYAAQSHFLKLLQQLDASRVVDRTVTTSNPMTLTSLPKIDLPVFSGDINRWTEYIALFTSLIHDNASLDDLQKFHYLRVTLSGTALATVSGFAISKQNYILALKALTTRYENPRLIANFSIQQLFDFTPLKSSSHGELQHFVRVHKTAVDSLKAIDNLDLANFLLFSLALSKLDMQTRKAFENKAASSINIPTFESLLEFVTQATRTLELCGLDNHPVAKKRFNSLLTTTTARAEKSTSYDSKSVGHSNVVKSTACVLCKDAHSLYRCPVFGKLSVDDKYNTLRRLQRCFNCLGAHMRSQCASQRACSTCNSREHHSLLHVKKVSAPIVASSTVNHPSRVDTPPHPQALSCRANGIVANQPIALLGTVRALIRDSFGQFHPVRAVIDSGSQISAITHALSQQLGLKVRSCPSELSGIGHSTVRVFGTVHCTLSSRHHSETSLGVQALVLSSISNALPPQEVPVEVFDRYRGLLLADDRFHVPDQIEFLIGADLYPDILARSGDIMIGTAPSALNTVFGWVVIGPVRSQRADSPEPLSLFTIASPELERTLRLFWETEEIARPPQVDPDSQLCEDHFLATHKRDLTGRYSVALPFKPARSNLSSNRGAALHNFVNLERRLRNNPEHEVAYTEFMRDYVTTQHMQPATTSSSYVIPHHCVHKITSSSTKLRVVFNASAPDDRGVSLNEQLLSGPKLQGDLPCILTCFRTHAIAICADIRQMYRQIQVRPADRVFQHIFWRPAFDSPIVEYELNTVTYGLTPSAFLAQRVLKQLVSDEGDEFPLAARAVTSHTYIDDIVSGAPNLTQARALQSELQALLARGGFSLRKWASNHPDALNAVPEDHLEIPLVFSPEEQGIKILGMLWDPRSDEFSFRGLPFEGPVTKRTALSYIARIFDPLGLVAPFVSWLKMFLQRLWLTQLQWDDALPKELSSSWHSAVADVSELGKFRLPRPFPSPPGVFRVVGFCDASEKGYAAVLYLHTTTDSSFHVSLLRARSKVAPVKPLTIPKLELSAALLLTRLLNATLPALADLRLDSSILYTDSTIVLAWLSTPPHRLKTFVAHRVVEILEQSAPDEWAHVLSHDNPADCASRGLSASELLTHPLWQCGPSFLSSPISTWPRATHSCNLDLDLPELKPLVATLAVRVDQDQHLTDPLRKYSTLLRAQRVYGHVVRFARILLSRRNRTPAPIGPLCPSELQDALDILISITQQHFYATEIRQITLRKQVSSKIASLNPFLTPDGVLKVGGRLRYSSLPEAARHPVLLPKTAHLSSLLCDSFHLTSLHSGPRTVQALIQQNFWIVSLRGLLRQRIRKCITCHKFRARPLQPPMADLPAARVQSSRAFSHVGTDFAGPFSVKFSSRRNAPSSKGYLCLFVCMATKAVHLEMVSELSTVAFLACFDRFVSRRGLPEHIYSDCGRNYVGAARHLREMHDLLRQSEPAVTDALAARGVFWHFNPPYAPNFGGLWEAGVKSAKSLLHRLISDTPHTFEEYATLFARIEAVLNSRPLCATPSDPAEGPDYLSPGHFLIGSPLIAPPEKTLPDDSNHVSRWHRVRRMHQAFWKRWSSEYLHTQMQRGKWVRGSPNLREGDVVFFVAPTRPLSWPIGRVIELHPGQDGVTRVVSIRTSNGITVRPVNKLVTLPPA